MKNLILFLLSFFALTAVAAPPPPIQYGPGTTNTPANWTNTVRGAVAAATNLKYTNVHIFGLEIPFGIVATTNTQHVTEPETIGNFVLDLQFQRANANMTARNLGVILGGHDNTCYGGDGAVVSGTENVLKQDVGAGIILAGTGNVLGYTNDNLLVPLNVQAGFIGAGNGNLMEVGWYSGIVAGDGNRLNADYGFIGGGQHNVISNQFGSILGGQRNKVGADYATAIGNSVTNTEPYSVRAGYSTYGMTINSNGAVRLDWSFVSGGFDIYDEVLGNVFSIDSAGEATFAGEVNAGTFLGSFSGNGAGITGVVLTRYTTYAAGTAYTLTATPAALDFGTTDPTITIAVAGTYLIQSGVGVNYNGATYTGTPSMAFKLRRTNNTAADLANGARSVALPVLTSFTGGDAFPLPGVVYTATAGDIVTIFGSVSALPSAGSVTVTSADIVAIRIQ